MNSTSRMLVFARVSAVIMLLATASELLADEPAPAAAESKAVQRVFIGEHIVEGIGNVVLDPTDQTLFVKEAEAGSALLNANRYTLIYRTLVARADSLIGINATAVDDVLRSHLGLGEGKGLLVASVADDSPAARAGIQKNDVLVGVADQELAGSDELEKLLEAAAGKATLINLIRSGLKQTVLVIPRLPTTTQKIEGRDLRAADPRFWLGLGLASADDTLRSHLAIAPGQGLVVTGVEENSPASKAGVMLNDLLLNLDGRALTTAEGLVAQLQEIADKSVSLGLLRHGKPTMLTIAPERRRFEGAVLHLVGHDELRFTAISGLSAGLTLASAQTIDPSLFKVAGYVVLDTNQQAQPEPNLAKQVSDLIEQARQLQKALDTLDAAVKAQTPATTPGGEQK